MKKCDSLLIKHSDIIDKTLCSIDSNNRAFLATLTLGQLRHFVEHVILKIYCEDNHLDLDDGWVNISQAVKYVYSHNQYNFIRRFHHNHLQKSVSHKMQDEDASETLMLLYLEPLIQIKDFILTRYNIETLKNLNKFPLDLDNTFLNYYKKIQEVVFKTNVLHFYETDYYYVHKKKPIWLDGKLMYELTLGPVNDYANKFDRFIAFSKQNVFDNYAIEASMVDGEVDCFGLNVPIKILTDYSVSIRTYELNNLGKIVNSKEKVNKKQKEFNYLMRYLTETNITLDEIAQFSEKDFESFSNMIVAYSGEETPILNILKLAREIIINNKPGSNVLKYLLCHLKNTIVTAQISKEPNSRVSDLYLKNGTLIFDETPYAANLIKSKEPIRFVFGCIDDFNADCQILARKISNISNQTGQLYIKSDLVYQGDDLDQLINDFNKMLPDINSSIYRKIQKYNNYLYIQENETNTYRVLKTLLSKTRNGVPGYQNQASSWMRHNDSAIKGEEKKNVLQNMFASSRVYVLYGAAGTGKSTTVSFVFQILHNVSKLCLAATHPAVENMKRKIKDQAARYMTIQKFLSDETIKRDWDIVVIDECSVVSNRDMLKLLEIVNCSVMLLTGDIYQLPSIDFGNWFHIAKYVLPSYAIGELKRQFRTDDNTILDLWQKVRQFDESIYEYLSSHSMTTNRIDETIFETLDDDQIILCYNYDGLYGINSINKYLQSKNKHDPVYWKQYVFKVGDPVVFSNTSRFSGVLFNNLKGKIVKIVKYEKSITFDVAVDTPLTEINLRENQASFVQSLDDGWTVIRFTVYDYEKERDDEPQEMHTIPFQIAYAVSIHKSQGLEYNAVKIIIANNVDELISHNIFYTAITRAKKQIKIYWTPETANKVLSSFEPHFDSKDGAIIKNKYHL